MHRRVVWCLAGALAALAAHAQLGKPDTEELPNQRDWRENALKLPEYPHTDRLVEFNVSAITSFRFFIDPATLTAGDDGVVRYVLVALSPSGARNVWYEGMRCKTGELKQYATARDDTTWNERRAPGWVAIEPKKMNRQHQALRRQYFCPQGVPIQNAAEGIDALRRGGHPHAKHD